MNQTSPKLNYCYLLASLLSLFSMGTNLLSAATFEEVDSWAYQLTGYEEGGLDAIIESSVDLIVIDLAKDGVSEYFSKQDIEAIKAKDKIVLAYFEIGGIEDYRPEWDEVAADIKLGAVDNWPREQYVKYWDDRWWPVVRNRVDQAINAGYDGIFLDLLTAYIEAPNTGFSDEERAKLMVDLVIRISKHAKSNRPDFKIVPQNCPELATWSHWEPRINQKYLKAIDGCAIESPFYQAHDKPCKASWCRENREDAFVVKKQGKLLLSVDYAKQAKTVLDSYQRQREAGFIPYVSNVELDHYEPEPK